MKEPAKPERRSERAKCAGLPAANDVGGLVVTTSVQLAALVREAVRDALECEGAARGSRGGLFFDRAEIAERLSVSPGLIDKMRRQGMPCVYVGDSPRFSLDECLAWCASARQKTERTHDPQEPEEARGAH